MRELSARLDSARKLRATISLRGPEMLDGYRTRLRDRLDRLLSESGVQVDAGRQRPKFAFLATHLVEPH